LIEYEWEYVDNSDCDEENTEQLFGIDFNDIEELIIEND
jgi:hypothetical protein